MPTSFLPNPTAAWLALEQVDALRRWQGRVLDGLGFGPARTPCHLKLRGRAFRLLGYDGGRPGAPAALLIPAPIKKAYVWDMEPQVSVVRRLLSRHAQVYLLEWQPPEDERGGLGDISDLGLNHYAGRAIGECVQVIRGDTGQRPYLLGHSLGATLAGLHGARHPDALAGLVLVEGPLAFPRGEGALTQAVHGSVNGHARERGHALPTMPGSALNLAAVSAAPEEYVTWWLADLADSLRDPAASRLHMKVMRWSLDEMAMPARLYDEVLDLMRSDALMQGTLRLDGGPVSPEPALDVLAVTAPECEVLSPRQLLDFVDRAQGRRKNRLAYTAETGVALRHVGPLVGRAAHKTLWPHIITWMEQGEAQ